MNPEAKTTWCPLPPMVAQENCAVCHGTGWELHCEAGMTRASRCRCGALNRLLKLRELVRIPARYEHCSFDTYRSVTVSQARALAEARKFAQRYPDVPKGLFFTGDAGVGKTHLAVAIVCDLLQRFHDDTLFVDYEAFLYCYRRTHSARGNEGWEWERLKRVSLLVLDNFGLSGLLPESMESTEDCLHARSLAKKCTIYTGQTCQMLAHLLAELKIVPIHGEDYRRDGRRGVALF